MATSITFNSGGLSPEDLQHIIDEVMPLVNGVLPILDNDPDLNDPNAARIWIVGGEVRFNSNGEVKVLDTKGDLVIQDLSGNNIAID